MGHDGLARVKREIEEAARAAGRDAASVTLIAVSKTFAEADIVPVIAAGQRHFGENRVQEAKGKWPGLRRQWPDLRLHLIGPLQTNKTAEAVALFDAIHSIDRPKLAAMVAREIEAQNRRPQLFIQVNIGREAQKAGVDPDSADGFIALCREGHGLTIAGLMCIPPADADPRPHFEELARIARRSGLTGLSMGMSGDFPAAIAAGATHVRVGSAIFGARPGH